MGFSLVFFALASPGCKSDKKPSKATTTQARGSGDSESLAVGADPNASAEPAPIPAPPDVDDAPSDAVRTPSGLATKVLSAGGGKMQPKPSDRVRVHYTGWKKDGTMFDSSVRRRTPTTLEVGKRSPGFAKCCR
jgi:FKBP-type peptidyl-prolyl cis-trans isomerase